MRRQKINKMDTRKVYYIPGDGIGPEIWRAAWSIVQKALELENAAPVQWEELPAGEKAMAETGSPLPLETIEKLSGSRWAIKGPLGTPVGGGIRSLNVALRQGLDLYACIRPISHMPGLATPVVHPERVNMVIFRENTEDVYAGVEFAASSREAKALAEFLRDTLNTGGIGEDAAIGIKPMTEKGTRRLVRAAISYALEKGLPSVTLVHKGNIMKFTEGAFRKWGYEVAREEFGDFVCTEADAVPGKIIINDRIADAMFQEALLRPERYSVLATPNLNGDYLSDALAAQVGGLGLAPGVNKSDTLSFYEAIHGTAPDIAGQDRANPGSMILCGAMLLEEMGELHAASRIRQALAMAIAGKRVPADLALQMENAEITGCAEFGEIVERNLEKTLN